MNRKVYVANLPYQAGETELKAPFSKAGDVMSIKIVLDRQTGAAERHCLRGDVHAIGRPKGCFHAEPDRFHGEEPAGKRGSGKTGFPREIGVVV